jgi:hypothetical protein
MTKQIEQMCSILPALISFHSVIVWVQHLLGNLVNNNTNFLRVNMLRFLAALYEKRKEAIACYREIINSEYLSSNSTEIVRVHSVIGDVFFSMEN